MGRLDINSPKSRELTQSPFSIQISQFSTQDSYSRLHSLPKFHLHSMSNQFNQRGQGAGGYGQSPYGGGQHQQQQQQRPGIGSTQNTPDAASQSGQGEGYEDPDEQDLDPNTPSPQQSSKQPGQPQRPGQGQAQLNGSAGQVAKKPDGAAGGKTKASVAPQHAHSRFAQDPNHHATMQQFANIASKFVLFTVLTRRCY